MCINTAPACRDELFPNHRAVKKRLVAFNGINRNFFRVFDRNTVFNLKKCKSDAFKRANCVEK